MGLRNGPRQELTHPRSQHRSTGSEPLTTSGCGRLIVLGLYCEAMTLGDLYEELTLESIVIMAYCAQGTIHYLIT